MKIKKVRIMNYKSIADSGFIDINDNFTILAGKNNVGKTAFIEVLFSAFQKSIVSPPGGRNNYEDFTQLQIILDVSDVSEIHDAFRQEIEEQLWSNTILVHFLSLDNFSLPFMGAYAISSNQISFDRPIIHWEKNIYCKTINGATYNLSTNIHKFINAIHNYIREKIIFISAKRSIQENQQITVETKLNITASNLYSVLHTLQSNDKKVFNKIENAFKQVFPDVKILASTIQVPNQNNQTQTTIKLDFDNLEDIPIHECGSGLTHFLIMLYAIYAEDQRIILFDEPHTFLHPSAEKAMYDLASQNSNHQYLFTTHSPILINYPAPKNIYLIKKENGQSKFTPLVEIKEIFEDIGITNSDYAFSDKVIFVEGPTEEIVLPLILKKYNLSQLGYNYNIINLNGKDAITGKSVKNSSAHILETIFDNIGAFPIPYKILLDSDGKNQQQKNKLQDLYKDKLDFLKRYEIENYFLVPEAIKAVLNSLGKDPNVEDITRIIENDNHQTEKGSTILEQIFEQNGIGNYDKLEHGYLLVEWMLKNDAGNLAEIIELLKPFLEK